MGARPYSHSIAPAWKGSYCEAAKILGPRLDEWR